MISGLFRSIKRSISPFVLHLSLSLCKGYGFAGTPPAADPAVADAVAGEIHEGGRQRIWSRCYSRPSEDPGFFFSFFFPKFLNRHFSRIASSPIPVPRSSWRPQANEMFRD